MNPYEALFMASATGDMAYVDPREVYGTPPREFVAKIFPKEGFKPVFYRVIDGSEILYGTIESPRYPWAKDLKMAFYALDSTYSFHVNSTFAHRQIRCSPEKECLTFLHKSRATTDVWEVYADRTVFMERRQMYASLAKHLTQTGTVPRYEDLTVFATGLPSEPLQFHAGTKFQEALLAQGIPHMMTDEGIKVF